MEILIFKKVQTNASERSNIFIAQIKKKVNSAKIAQNTKKLGISRVINARDEGIEPPTAVLETAVMPLN